MKKTLFVFLITHLASLTPSVFAQTPQNYSLTFSTFIGGGADDQIRDVDTDSQGNIYVTGGTDSINFPATVGAYDTTHNGWTDVFVTKFNPNGQIIWSTFLGGVNYDRAYAIELDNQGNVFVAGRAGADFPVNGFDTSFAGGGSGLYGTQDGFACKLNSTGGTLIFCTYFGGSDDQIIRDIDVDASGNIYLASTVCNDDLTNDPLYGPALANAFQKNRSTGSSGCDGVVAKLRSDGSNLVWLTYLGGSGDDSYTPSIRVGNDDSAFMLLAWTTSTGLPTPNGFDTTLGGSGDTYLGRISNDGRILLYGTYLGGSNIEFSETHALAIDANNIIYTGITTLSSDYPTTLGAYDRSFNGLGGSGTGSGTNYPGDIAVSKINTALSGSTSLLASTYLGGSFGEGAEGIGVDSSGNVYVGGATYSNNFPVSSNAFRTTNSGDADFFASNLSSGLNQLLYSTYLGGSVTDWGRTATADSNGNFYVSGMTQSSNWPTLNAIDTSLGGSWDATLAKFSLPQSPTNTPSPVPPTPTPTTSPPSPTPTPAHCLPLGDIDCSTKVNVLDLSALLGAFGSTINATDLDDSGRVNVLDLSILLGNFGK